MRFRVIVVSLCLVMLAGAAVLVSVAFRGGTGDAGKAEMQVLLAAGDIAECDHQGDEATANILARYPSATIAALGDLAYQHGTPEEFMQCYGPSWG
jgi:hypothetical protein